MIRLANDSPNPHPRGLVEKPESNTRFCTEGDMPRPVSPRSTYTCRESDDTTTVKVPAPSMASMAFLQTFSITHSNR